jgi:transposase
VNQYIGKSRCGNTTKIHAVVDGLGNPVHFKLSGGQVNDNTIAIDLLSYIDIKSANILGDKTYGTKEIRTYITSREAVYTLPLKSNTKDPWDCGWWIYKERHLVECFFNKIKHFRRVATRYDKLASSFHAFVYIAAIWLLSKSPAF